MEEDGNRRGAENREGHLFKWTRARLRQGLGKS